MHLHDAAAHRSCVSLLTSAKIQEQRTEKHSSQKRAKRVKGQREIARPRCTVKSKPGIYCIASNIPTTAARPERWQCARSSRPPPKASEVTPRQEPIFPPSRKTHSWAAPS